MEFMKEFWAQPCEKINCERLQLREEQLKKQF